MGTLANLAAHGVAEDFNANGVAAALVAHGPDALYALLLGTAHAEVLSELMRLMAAVVALRFPDGYSVPEAWQLPLGSPEVAARLVHVFANSLHSELLERTAALVLAAYPLGRIPYSLHEAGALAALCGATRALARRADEDGGSRAAGAGRRRPRCRGGRGGELKEDAKRVAAMGDDDGDTDDEAPPMPLTLRLRAASAPTTRCVRWRRWRRGRRTPTACAACGFWRARGRRRRGAGGAGLPRRFHRWRARAVLRRLEAEVDAAAPAGSASWGRTGWDAPDESVVRAAACARRGRCSTPARA